MQKSDLSFLFGRGILSAALIISTILCIQVALDTPLNAHPDEIMHVDAFRYFAAHWWPPDLNSDQLRYSRYGVSRVYSGELVYLVYGKLGELISVVLGRAYSDFHVYRLLNVALFVLTVATIASWQSSLVDPQRLAIVFLCIPQIQYVYSYANYDAMGISFTVFFFLWALNHLDRGPKFLSWKSTVSLGLILGFILASRKSFFIGLGLPAVSLLGSWINYKYKGSFIPKSQTLIQLLVVVVIALSIAMPLKVIYPWTQENYDIKKREMVELRAKEGFKRSNPTFPFFNMSKKGIGYFEMLFRKPYEWVSKTARSFYALFGYMKITVSWWIYWTAWSCILFLSALSLFNFVLRWKEISLLSRIIFLSSPVILGMTVVASIYRSMHVDFQAQGRYLFCAIVPLGIMMLGLVPQRSCKALLVERTLLFVLFILNIYALGWVAIQAIPQPFPP